MSQLTTGSDKRGDRIYEYLEILIAGHATKQDYQRYKTYIDTISRRETIEAVDRAMRDQSGVEEIKKGVNRFVTGISSTLMGIPLPAYPESSVLSILSQENTQIKRRMEALKPAIQALNKQPSKQHFIEASKHLSEIRSIDRHYLKLQNILFPAVEAVWPDFRCTQLMWSYHDDILGKLSRFEHLKEEDFGVAAFNREIGRFYFDVYAMIFREDYILYPEIQASLSEKVLRSCYQHCFEFGFTYISPPPPTLSEVFKTEESAHDLIDLETGAISNEQLILLLNSLPCDVTYVDEHDRVAYFSDPDHRIFPRSKAVLGRKVQNCHPPESVHVVQRILDEFRYGARNDAEFWIQVSGQKIHIRYFALRDEAGMYRGCLEVSQEISSIQSLQGEKRLID